MSADKRPEHHKRDLLLSDRISQGTVKDIIKDIFEINFDDDEKEEIYKDWERKPIQLFINSYGGSVYDGLALIDVIKRSKTPVHLINSVRSKKNLLPINMTVSKRMSKG